MNKGIGIAILIGLGLLLFFVTRKGLSAPALASGCSTCQPLKLMPAGSLANNQFAGHTIKRYVNEEHWHIDKDEDGIPTDVHIKRDVTEVV